MYVLQCEINRTRINYVLGNETSRGRQEERFATGHCDETETRFDRCRFKRTTAIVGRSVDRLTIDSHKGDRRKKRLNNKLRLVRTVTRIVGTCIHHYLLYRYYGVLRFIFWIID